MKYQLSNTEAYIHIDWDGPFNRDEAVQKFDGSEDYGLYQFYGHHMVYGNMVLLYVGKAEDRTFSKRIAEHNWEKWTSIEPQIYIGRIVSRDPIDAIEHKRQISLAENMILQSHCPSFNSSNLISIGSKKNGRMDTHLFNWGHRGSLLPELSIMRWEGEYAIGNKLHSGFARVRRDK